MGKYDSYKKTILDACQWMVKQGYVVTGGSGGNISMRIEGENAVAVSPSSMDYMELVEDDICVVDYDLKAIESKHSPSVETRMHVAVYKNRLDVNCIVHTHQVFASVFALINEPIPALFDEVIVNIGNVVEIIPYGMSGSNELLQNVESKVGNQCMCYIIQNHGALNLGMDMKAALMNVGLLEKVARVYYYALSTNKPISIVPEEQVNAFYKFLKSEQKKEIRRKKKSMKQ